MTERYRLAPVRDARDREVRVKRGNLAAAVTEARASEAQIAAAAARVEAATAALIAARSTASSPSAVTARSSTSAVTPALPTSALALVRAEHFIARRRRDLELAREDHARAIASHAGQLASVDAARNRLAAARADREVIERHFTRWREARAKLAERRAD